MKVKVISFKTAKLAKEKGFNWGVFFSYEVDRYTKRPKLCYGEFLGRPVKNEFGYPEYPSYRLCNFNSSKNSITYSAPEQSILQKWLRDVHNIHFHIYYGIDRKWGVDIYNISNNIEEDYCAGLMTNPNQFTNIGSYEEALEQGLQEALKLI